MAPAQTGTVPLEPTACTRVRAAVLNVTLEPNAQVLESFDVPAEPRGAGSASGIPAGQQKPLHPLGVLGALWYGGIPPTQPFPGKQDCPEGMGQPPAEQLRVSTLAPFATFLALTGLMRLTWLQPLSHSLTKGPGACKERPECPAFPAAAWFRDHLQPLKGQGLAEGGKDRAREGGGTAVQRNLVKTSQPHKPSAFCFTFAGRGSSLPFVCPSFTPQGYVLKLLL